MGLANVGTAIVGVYATMIGLKQIPALQFRLSWRWTAAIALGPVAVIAAFFPSVFMDNILTFMYLLGVVFAPVVAIQIVDYYVFRKQDLHIPSLYDYSSKGHYWFWGGFNLVALVATIVGMFVYWILLDPVTYENRLVVGDVIVFQWTTASIATIVVTGAVYWLLTRLVSIPMGRGGYGQESPSVAATTTEATATVD